MTPLARFVGYPSTTMRTYIVIHTPDGRTYPGSTSAAAVSAMLAGSAFTAAKSPEEYMLGVARRMRLLEGATIRHSDADSFLTDLEAGGFIRIDRQS